MPIFVVVPNLPAAAMAIYPLILVKNPIDRNDAVLINHEKIHHRQQLELLLLPFYVFYLVHYLVNLMKYGNHYQAYLNIVFEKEAYANEGDLAYIKHRKFFAWFKWFKG
jgi:hypothetical protein